MTHPSTLDVARFVWRYWMREAHLFRAVTAMIAVLAVIDTLLPVMTGRFIDIVAAGRQDDVWPALATVIGITVSYYAVRYVLMVRLMMWLATRVMRPITAEAFARVQRFSADWHANAFAGATVRRIGRGMWAYDIYADTVLLALLTAVLTLVGLSIMLALQWPLLGLAIALLAAAHLSLGYWLAARYVAPANQVHMAADSAIGATMADAITCNPVVKSFGAEAREDARFRGVMAEWAGRAVAAWKRSENMVLAQAAVQIAMMATLLGYTTWASFNAAATPGDVVLALTTFFVIDSHLRHASFHIRNAQQAVNELEDLVLFDRETQDVVDRPGAITFRPGRGAIRFDGVRFAYANQDAPIYEDFALDIAPGERVGLVGRSGSGKSTFVKLLQRLHDIDAGRILIDEQDIAGVTQASLRQAIALVPQDPALFHRTLAENIAYARPGASRDEIVRAARKAHADDFIRRLPLGYDTEVGERGVKLSGGERQRVAIARAFLADAPILVLDEATSSLDSHTEAVIQEAMEELMGGRTTILIAHRLSTLRNVDRVLVFRDGRIVEQGTHAQLLALPRGEFRALLETQAAGLAL